MKRRWKILIGIVGGLLLVATGGLAWINNQPWRKSQIVDSGPTGRRISDQGLLANYFPAAGEGRKPGILLLGGSEGGLDPELRAEALLLQKAGFNVLHVAYHNAPGKPPNIVRIPLEEFHLGIDWLMARPEVDPGAIGIVGNSKGAEAALLVASRRQDVKAVVAGMPSSVAWDGMSLRSYIFGGVSSWSEGGEQLASLPYGSQDGKEELLPLFVNAFEKLDEHKDAIIPVERFGGRLLLVCGGKDKVWPSCPMAEQISARVREARKPGPELLAYPEAGHSIMIGVSRPASDPKQVRISAKLGGTPEANAAASSDAWKKITEFLTSSLAPGPDGGKTAAN